MELFQERKVIRVVGQPARIARLLALVIVILGISCAFAWGGSQGPGFAKGHILVKFRDGVDNARKGLALGQVNASGSHQLGSLSVHWVDLPAGASEKAAVEALK